MSVAELKKEIIRRIEKTEDEALIKKVAELMKAQLERPSIGDIYNDLKEQYGETLKRLAQ